MGSIDLAQLHEEKIVEVLYFDPDQSATDASWSEQHIK